jgi:GntR family transcriptional regulator
MALTHEVRQHSCGRGVPVIQLVRTAFDTDDGPVEVCDTLMAADSYNLSYSLAAD